MANKYHNLMEAQKAHRNELRERGLRNIASRPSQTDAVAARDAKNYLKKTGKFER